MRIGIGLPAAVPGTDMTQLGRWATEAERAGFAAVGVIDRLVYDNLDPLTALAAAAASTRRIELISTVINVCWRNNAALLAKQLSSVVRLSGGRLTAGLGMGAWPADYEASDLPRSGLGARLDDALATMRGTWQSTDDRPRIMVGGGVSASYARAASDLSDGWVAPLFGQSLLHAGVAGTEQAWAAAGRAGRPRILTGRYFCLGPDAPAIADDYIRHYYGDAYFDFARADTLTGADQIDAELERLAAAGCTDVLLYPCSGDVEQVAMLGRALSGCSHRRAGANGGRWRSVDPAPSGAQA